MPIKLSDKISIEIMNQLAGTRSDIMLPNFYVGRYEMDVFKLTKSGFISEYEIKISKSDFLADFRKYDCWNGKKTLKHDLIKSGGRACNRFYFVTPQNILTIKDIPPHSGWIEMHDSGYLDVKKNAPVLHKRKYEDFDTLSRTLAFREANLRLKIRILQQANSRLNKK